MEKNTKIDTLLKNDIENIKKNLNASKRLKALFISKKIRRQINFITLVDDWVEHKKQALIVIKSYIEGYKCRKLFKKKID